jgi:hypothetical protein
MRRIAGRKASRLAALLLVVLLGGCALPTVHWSQRVTFNGRTFVFARIESLRESAQGDRVDYQGGDFLVEGKGPITVNGFEIDVLSGAVQLANQKVRLAPGDEVHFGSDMSWSVRPSRGQPATPPAR